MAKARCLAFHCPWREGHDEREVGNSHHNRDRKDRKKSTSLTLVTDRRRLLLHPCRLRQATLFARPSFCGNLLFSTGKEAGLSSRVALRRRHAAPSLLRPCQGRPGGKRLLVTGQVRVLSPVAFFFFGVCAQSKSPSPQHGHI